MMNRARFQTIDAVRGAAILWIVVFHLLNEHLKLYPPFLSAVIRSGHLGVPLFFLVSGFAVSTAADKVLQGKETAFQFLRRRLSRIYRPLIFSLITAGFLIPVLCAVVCYPFGVDASEFFFHYSFWEWVGLFTLTKVFVPVAGDLNRAFLPLNGVLWFLAVLVQMYGVVFLALLGRKFYGAVLAGVTVLWSLTLLPGGHAWVPRGLFIDSWGFFGAGLALYRVLNQGSVKLRWALCLAGGLVMMLGFTTLNFTVFCALFLWALHPYDARISSYPWFGPCAFLGSFSYSLYLLHIPLDRLVSLIVEVLLLRFKSSAVPWQVIDPLIILPGIVGLAWLWSLYFEREEGVKLRLNLRN